MPRKPFSNKQKKEQLQKKRELKRNKADKDDTNESDSDNEKVIKTVDEDEFNVRFVNSKKLNEQPKLSDKKGQNRFNLEFMKESHEELKRNKKLSFKPLEYRDETALEVTIEDFYKPGSSLDMPIRPKWSYEMTKQQLDNNEKNYFEDYLNKIFESFSHNELSYFEMNLETWRQLWRVLEISDIILLIVDIRFAALHFSPTFYEQCMKQNKDVILVLNKIDLVSSSLVVAWKTYFENKYPNLHVLLFSSSKQITFKKSKQRVKLHEKKEQANIQEENEYLNEEEQIAIKSAAAEIHTANAHRRLYECVKEIVKNSEVDLKSWEKLTENLASDPITKANKQDHVELHSDVTNADEMHMQDLMNSLSSRKKFEHGFVTIGCCGFPNVGKSSLLNSLKGRKCVSVSKTPGHTKHLQTIFLTKTVRLCDCPGLVFPSLCSKPLQVLAGIYPIAQLQEPYSAIRYLAENIQMIDLIKLQHPDMNDFKSDPFYKDKVFEWSASDICEAWANKRGFYTAKACRPDVYRAANELLRMALGGRLCLGLKPQNFSREREYWENHPETKRLQDIIKSVEADVKKKLEDLNLDEINTSSDDKDSENYLDDAKESSYDFESDQESTSQNPYDLLNQE